MKLVRFGKAGSEKPGIVDADGVIRDVSSLVTDFAGDALSSRNLAKLKKVDLKSLPAVRKGTRLGSCVARPGNFIAVGLNFADHAAETGATPPSEPNSLQQGPELRPGTRRRHPNSQGLEEDRLGSRTRHRDR